MCANFELKQRKFMAGSRTFSINKIGYVSVKYKYLLSSKEYKVELYCLDPNFVRIKRRDVKWLIATFVFAVGSIWVFYGAFRYGALLSLYSPIFLIPAYLCLFKFQNKSFDIMTVLYAQNGKNAFNIWYKKPDEIKFKSFMDTLKYYIDKIKISQNVSEDEKLKIYTNYIQFFCEEGILLNEEGNSLLQRTMKRVEARKMKKANILSIMK